MDHRYRNIRFLIRWIPMIVIIIGILVLTLQNMQDNTRLSENVRFLLIKIYRQIGIDSNAAWWNDRRNIRRLGHIVEYGMLGMCCAIEFTKRKWLGILLCLIISILDQTTKIFIPLRHFDLIDIGFDVLGIAIGYLAIYVLNIIIELSGLKKYILKNKG